MLKNDMLKNGISNQIKIYICYSDLPARYGTVWVVTSNLSLLVGLTVMLNNWCSTRMVRDTVVGEGCRNPGARNEKQYNGHTIALEVGKYNP